MPDSQIERQQRRMHIERARATRKRYEIVRSGHERSRSGAIGAGTILANSGMKSLEHAQSAARIGRCCGTNFQSTTLEVTR